MLKLAGRTSTVAVAVVLLLVAAACGGAPAPDASPAPAVPSTVGDQSRPGTTDGTVPGVAEAGDAASDPLAEIGEDDAFPDLGTPDLDVDDYALELDYDPGTGRLEGTATLEATLARDADQIELHFQGLAVDAASVDGEAVDHESTADKVVLELAGPTEAGTDVTIEIDYSGVPEPVPTEALGGVEVGWHGGDDGSFVLSEPEGASTWYPVNNHPLDKATYTFRVTVPEPYAAIANGALLSRTPGAGGTTFEWRMAEPMASYLATVITGEFDEVDGGVHDDVTATRTGTPPAWRRPRRSSRATWWWPSCPPARPLPVRHLRRGGVPAVVHHR